MFRTINKLSCYPQETLAVIPAPVADGGAVVANQVATPLRVSKSVSTKTSTAKGVEA